MLDLDAIKARLAAATPGPWEEEREGGGYPTGVVYGPDCTVTSCDSEPGTIHQCTNAIFIANAPSDIAALVAEVERLNESTMTISWTERATEEACGVSVGLDPLSDVTWTSFYVGVEIRAFFVCLSQWERRVALAEVERLTRERDLQPTITAEDAARCAWNVCGDEPEDGDAAERIDAALRAHAVRAKVPRG